MIMREDIANLWALRDDRYAVMCVKHNHVPKEDTKFLVLIKEERIVRELGKVDRRKDTNSRNPLGFVSELDHHGFRRRGRSRQCDKRTEARGEW